MSSMSSMCLVERGRCATESEETSAQVDTKLRCGQVVWFFPRHRRLHQRLHLPRIGTPCFLSFGSAFAYESGGVSGVMPN